MPALFPANEFRFFYAHADAQSYSAGAEHGNTRDVIENTIRNAFASLGTVRTFSLRIQEHTVDADQLIIAVGWTPRINLEKPFVDALILGAANMHNRRPTPVRELWMEHQGWPWQFVVDVASVRTTAPRDTSAPAASNVVGRLVDTVNPTTTTRSGDPKIDGTSALERGIARVDPTNLLPDAVPDWVVYAGIGVVAFVGITLALGYAFGQAGKGATGIAKLTG